MEGLLDENRRRRILEDVMRIDELNKLDSLIRELSKDVRCVLKSEVPSAT